MLKENTLAATLDDLSQLMLRQIFVDECLNREIEPDSEIGLKLEHMGFYPGSLRKEISFTLPAIF